MADERRVHCKFEVDEMANIIEEDVTPTWIGDYRLKRVQHDKILKHKNMWQVYFVLVSLCICCIVFFFAIVIQRAHTS